MSRRHSASVASAALLTLLWWGTSTAQQPVPPPNGYSPRDDVEMGVHAAVLVERRLPVLHDEAVTRYLASVVRRLAAALPPDLRHPEFRYSVQVIDVREVSARALPGGPIYLDRGLLESTRTPGEVAGVIAHELGHIALRHATAHATRVAEVTSAALARALLAALDEAPTEHQPLGGATALLGFAPECSTRSWLPRAVTLPSTNRRSARWCHRSRSSSDHAHGVPDGVELPEAGRHRQHLDRYYDGIIGRVAQADALLIFGRARPSCSSRNASVGPRCPSVLSASKPRTR